MSDHWLYLMLDLGAISVPFACSFYSKANFSSTWKSLAPAMIIPAIIFIIWDILFTEWGFWGFNPKYLTGYKISNLPVEEWLFFFCIPYACTFTYFSFNHLFKTNPLKKYEKAISWVLIIVMLIAGFWNLSLAYTSVTFISLAFFLLGYNVFIKKSLAYFYLTFIVILVPFFIINGVLTGTGIEGEVVWYNDDENLGIRMLTIPVEDTFYGMLLLIMNITLYDYFRFRNSADSAG
ncbi:lycopene cyclase domain-containing protein [Fulvivirga sediminis]|uniref:Lycopene cyclase domain-containing protein n=1 Tax=Fulvivirga sediminis TaxID=2803949 RepID=A0A937F831_9BACT|nr:lycopene cyclase domain-containing protein [Fulvivirga sediminis]MBL3657455.1 lycopene cyclase domain-containing protein [Fulvivirga sediminis]